MIVDKIQNICNIFHESCRDIRGMRDNRKKFVELAEARVNRTIKDIKLVGNLSNRSIYDFAESDVRQIFRALQKELDAAKRRFSHDGKHGGDAFRLE